MKEKKIRNKSVIKIENALLDLLMKTSLAEITVENIITEACISRGTFYKYFYDKFDVLESLENLALCELELIFTRHGFLNNLDTLNAKITKEVVYEIFYKKTLEVMRFFKKYDYLFVVALKHEETNDFIKKVTKMYVESFNGSIPKRYLIKHPVFYLKSSIHFMNGGVILLIKEWISGGLVFSPEKMSNMLLDLFCTQMHLL